MSRNEQIKIQEIVLNKLDENSRLSKFSELVSRLSKAISDITLREFYFKVIEASPVWFKACGKYCREVKFQ